MNLYFRFVLLLLKRIYIFKKISPLDPCETGFWVNPFDLDINLHMNNGRYLSIMDLGRIDLLLKAKCFWSLMFQGYYPVVASEGIRFKRSLQPFQFFTIKTQIDCWTDKDFFIKQEFFQNGSVVAEAYLKGRFLHRVRGSITSAELFKIIGLEYHTKPLEPKAEALMKFDHLMTK